MLVLTLHDILGNSGRSHKIAVGARSRSDLLTLQGLDRGIAMLFQAPSRGRGSVPLVMMVRWARDLCAVILGMLKGTVMRALSGARSHWRRRAVLVGSGVVCAVVSTVARSLGVNTLWDDHLGEARILRRRVAKTLGTDVNVGVVRDEMQLLVVRGGDAEGLLEETIGSVHVLAIVVSLAVIELAIGEKATSDTAWTPALAVSPATHAGLALIKAVDGARADGLALNVRKATMHARDKTDSTGCGVVNDTKEARG